METKNEICKISKYDELVNYVSEYINHYNTPIPVDMSYNAVIDYLQKYGVSREVISGNFQNYRTAEAIKQLQEIARDYRKQNGIYYTPTDVTDFIITNTLARYDATDNEIYTCIDHYIKTLSCEKANKIIYEMNIFDPTCGTGDFLWQVVRIKFRLLSLTDDKPDTKSIIKIFSTIYGNDKDAAALDECKDRLLSMIPPHTESGVSESINDILSDNLTNHDFININKKTFSKKFDAIVGNPPYVEDNISSIKPIQKYGNIYANIIQNSIDLLNDGGILGFVIPLSYVSTPRMSKIRTYVENSTTVQYALNYADRPSCLFTKVHQKLTILLARKGNNNGNHVVRTSNYKYWYKEERNSMFQNTQTIENSYINTDFYPKIANINEHNIFGKTYTTNNAESITGSMGNSLNESLYLNMRATFWIKAFSESQTSSEFKKFDCDSDRKHQLVALLNSSLFFFHWTCVSDCWHITAKDLKTFKVPQELFRSKQLITLAKNLENELERTKVAVYTKQTTHEYKHRLCKPVIDEIDDILAKFYRLTNDECNYVKNYNSRYRESKGVSNESH